MSAGAFTHSRIIPRWAAAVVVAAIAAGTVSNASGQIVRNAVGGVLISPDGVVGLPSDVDRAAMLKELRDDWTKAPADLEGLTELRKVSLSGLEAAVEAAHANQIDELPDEIRYLAGLQRIRFVFVYPETNDIVLAGPAEGWKINAEGIAVGLTTERPCLLLEDLLVALQSVNQARSGGISCSIDPTEEGYRALNAVLAQQRRAKGRVNVAALEQAMKRAFGPQQVKLTGVNGGTHFARVLVAADWRMKRMAMDLEEAPVAGLPSFLDLIKSSPPASLKTNPRWWLARDYEPLARSDDALAWEIRGQGVKALTEDEAVSDEGQVQATGRQNPAAEKWANTLTARYEELSAQTAVFGQLRNLMDMCVVAALIEKHDLTGRAGCSLPLLTGAAGQLSAGMYNTPQRVAPECSFLRTRSGWLVTASGGVQIDSWSAVEREELSPSVAQVRQKALAPPSRTSWRWN